MADDYEESQNEAHMDAAEEEAESYELQHYLNTLASQFDQLTVERHEAGAAEYGSVSFLGNDVVRMMLEELADTVNYCRMQGIKLLMLQERLEAEAAGFKTSTEGDIEINIGAAAFKGTKDIGWGQK